MRRRKRDVKTQLAEKQRALKQLLDRRITHHTWNHAEAVAIFVDIQQLQDTLNRCDTSKDPLKQYDPRRYDPHLQDIEERYVGKGSSLRCPRCGMPNRGNTVNGKPWCLDCNEPLVPMSEHLVKAIHHATEEVTYQPYDHAKRR